MIWLIIQGLTIYNSTKLFKYHKNESINYAADIRKNVVEKINSMLKTDIEKHIISESTLSPIDIEKQTSSYFPLVYRILFSSF